MAVTEHKAQGLVSVASFVLAVSDIRSVDTNSSGGAFATCSRARGTPFRTRDRQRRAVADGRRGAAQLADKGTQAIITTGCHVEDERLRFIARLLDGESMAALCTELGISRKTGYKIYDRYKDCGIQGLTDRSRRRRAR